MSSYPLVGLGTLLICLFLSLTAGHVGLIRLRLKIKAPAVIGPDAFDRAYRIQMNSIENAVVFLPALWILAGFVSDRVAAVAALLWLAGRVWYALSYQREPASRRPSFVFSTLIYVTTWLGALWGIAQTIRAGV
jgi:glutathione S-transferase